MSDIDKIAVGKRIKAIRANLGETAEMFGKHFDPIANRGLVSGWENGRYLPNPERLKRIAELGNTNVAFILYGSIENIVHQEILATRLDKSLDAENLTKITDTVIDYYKDLPPDSYSPDDIGRFLHLEAKRELSPALDKDYVGKKEFDSETDYLEEILLQLLFMKNGFDELYSLSKQKKWKEVVAILDNAIEKIKLLE